MFKKVIMAVFLFFLLTICFKAFSFEFDITAKVESKRKGNLITLIFKKRPIKDIYLIIENKKIIGKARLLNIEKNIKSNNLQYRVAAKYTLKENQPDFLKAGFIVGLVKVKKKAERDYGETKFKEKVIYKKSIISIIDKKKMMLIPAGKFVFGSNDGDKDELPQKVIFIDDFFIDKYEVSNNDYLRYVKETNVSVPAAWENGAFKEGEENFPIYVSYYEASAYSIWAGKSLPTEQEWEKSARGIGLEIFKKQDETYTTIIKPIIFPWGNKFNPGRLNSIEFWNNKKIGAKIKKQFKKGLLPVNYFEGVGDSIFGVVNLSGNAAEWTSSWFAAYEGNKILDKRYGKQVKVIRGGSWYSSKYKIRSTNREIGGLPNLYDDNIAGFRCIKYPTILDRLE